MKVTKVSGVWDDAVESWYSLTANSQICPNGLKPYPGIYNFLPTWPCAIVKFPVTQAKFLEQSGYCPLINCALTFRTINILVDSVSLRSISNSGSISSWIRRHYTFICATYKKHTKWSNAQQVNTPTTTILPITTGTCYGLNCFGHMIYVRRLVCTKMLQNLSHSLVKGFIINIPETFFINLIIIKA